MSPNALRLLKFAIDYPGWNSMGTNPKDIRSMNYLENKGLIEVVRYPGTKARPQFRIRNSK